MKKTVREFHKELNKNGRRQHDKDSGRTAETASDDDTDDSHDDDTTDDMISAFKEFKEFFIKAEENIILTSPFIPYAVKSLYCRRKTVDKHNLLLYCVRVGQEYNAMLQLVASVIDEVSVSTKGKWAESMFIKLTKFIRGFGLSPRFFLWLLVNSVHGRTGKLTKFRRQDHKVSILVVMAQEFFRDIFETLNDNFLLELQKNSAKFTKEITTLNEMNTIDLNADEYAIGDDVFFDDRNSSADNDSNGDDGDGGGRHNDDIEDDNDDNDGDDDDVVGEGTNSDGDYADSGDGASNYDDDDNDVINPGPFPAPRDPGIILLPRVYTDKFQRSSSVAAIETDNVGGERRFADIHGFQNIITYNDGDGSSEEDSIETSMKVYEDRIPDTRPASCTTLISDNDV